LRLPTWTVWLFAVLMFGSAYIGSSVLNAPWWAKVLLNISGPLMYIFILAGVASVYGYLRRKQNMAKGSAAMLSLVPVLFGGFGLQLYVLVAMWDTIFDFRGLGHGVLRRRPDETP
jgi:FtsH-binding integral membrane protein